MKEFTEIDISSFVNNRGITFEKNMNKGNLTYRVQSLPGEEILRQKNYFLNDVPFTLTYIEDGDNIESSNQTLKIPSIVGNKIHFLGASSNGDFFQDIQFLLNGQLKLNGRLFLSDFASKTPLFENNYSINLEYLHSPLGKDYSIKPSIWHYCIDLKRNLEFNEILLEDNISMHIFGITIEK